MPSEKVTRFLYLCLGGTVLTGGGGLAWHFWANPKNRAAQYAARAEVLVKSGATEAAKVAGFKALQLDSGNTRAIQSLMAGADAQDLLYLRSRLADLEPANSANLRVLARLALSLNRLDLARLALQDLKRAEAPAMETLELEVSLLAAEGRLAEAGREAQVLLAKDPANIAGRLILALSRILGPSGEADAAAEQELEALKDLPATRLEALRGLRQAALKRGAQSRALELCELVSADPRARFDDWLARADLIVALQPERLEEQLAALTAKAGESTPQLALIATWLQKGGHIGRIESWLDSHKGFRNDPASGLLIRANALLIQNAWGRLQTFTEGLAWPRWDILRKAFLARALREQKLEFQSDKVWHSALIEASKTPEAGWALCNAVRPWAGWELQLEEALWKSAVSGPAKTNRALAELIGRLNQRKDTTALRRLSEALTKADNNNEDARNDLAFYLLLQKAELTKAHRLAADLYELHPQDPAVVSTYAFSLLVQNEPQQALTTLEKLPGHYLQQKSIGLYYALALAGVGRTGEAREISSAIVPEEIFPEERALLNSAGLAKSPEQAP